MNNKNIPSISQLSVLFKSRFLWALSYCLILPASLSFADEDWQQVKDDEGITIFLREVEESAIKEFKGVIRIKSSLDSLAGVLHDNQACPQWVHQCIQPSVLQTLGFEERYVYQINDLPFPAANRDIIMHAQMTQVPQHRTITVHLTADAEYCLMKETPECLSINASNDVRITRSTGFYQLQPLADGRVEVTWQQHVEPAGALPEWMVNSMLVEVPFKTLSNLREIVKQEKYQKARLEYDDNGFAIGFKVKNW